MLVASFKILQNFITYRSLKYIYYDELDVQERDIGINGIRNNVNGNEIREHHSAVL